MLDASGLVVAPGLRRPAHALRRPTVLGPDGVAIERPRRDDHHRGQLWFHAGADQVARCRLHPPDDGQGRGHALGGARERRRLELGDLCRLSTAARGEPRGERRFPRRALRTSTVCHGRRVGRQRSRAGPARRHGRICFTSRIAAGGLGFSTTLSKTHSDGDGRAGSVTLVQHATRSWHSAGRRESTRARRSKASSTAASTSSKTTRSNCSSTCPLPRERPINWNVLTVDSRVPERVPRQLEASSRAIEAGGRIVALTMPVLVPMNMSFLNYCALNMLPGWSEILGSAGA